MTDNTRGRHRCPAKVHLENDSREEIPYDALVIDKLSDRTDLYVKVGVKPVAVVWPRPNRKTRIADRPTAGVRFVPTSEGSEEEPTHRRPRRPRSEFEQPNSNKRRLNAMTAVGRVTALLGGGTHAPPPI